jgi:large subunit ribosomal protein L29
MAVLRKKEIRKLDDKEARKKLDELRLELSKERAKINIGASVTSPGRIREIRRSIARILTNERERSKSPEEKHRNG